MTDQTRKYLALSRSVQANILAEIMARTESGAKKKIRTIYANRAKEIGGEWYFDILDAEGGVSRISSNVDPAGGIATQENIRVQIIAPITDIEKYTFTSQPLSFFLHLPQTGDVVPLVTGTIQRTQKTRQGIILHAATATDRILPTLPTKKVDLAEFPLAPIANANALVPVVFGEMNTAPESETRPDSAYLAHATCVDIVTPRFMANDSEGGSYGDLYMWDPAAVSYLPAPHTQDRNITTISRAVTVNLDHTVTPTPELPLRASRYSGDHVRIDIPTIGGLRTVNLMIVFSIDPASLPEIPTDSIFRLETDIDVYIKGQRHTINDMAVRRLNPGSQNPVIVSFSPQHLNVSVDDTLSIGDVYVDAAIDIASNPLISPFQSDVSIPLNVVATVEYENPFSGPKSLDNTYQSVAGYVDRAAQYADGGPVRAENSRLTSPIDIVVAMLRDKSVGLGELSENVDVGNIVDIRSFLGVARLDGQIGGSHAMTFEGSRNLLKSFGIILKHRNEKYQFQIRDSSPVALLTDTHITRVDTEALPLRDIYTEYRVSYGYSRALGRYKRHLLADPYHTLYAADASVGGTTVSLSGNRFESVLVGWNIHIKGGGVSSTRKITKKTNAGTVEVDGAAMPIAANVQVWAGPYFSYPCHLSAEKYGDQKNAKLVELDLVVDDATARQVLSRTVAYYTSLRHRIRLRCPISAARIEEGDRIAIDHRTLPTPLQAERVGSYPNGMPYAQVNISAGIAISPTEQVGVLYAKSQTDVEVLRVDAQSGRGMLDSYRLNWPSETEVYHLPHTWIIARREIDPERNTVTLHAETQESLV